MNEQTVLTQKIKLQNSADRLNLADSKQKSGLWRSLRADAKKRELHPMALVEHDKLNRKILSLQSKKSRWPQDEKCTAEYCDLLDTIEYLSVKRDFVFTAENLFAEELESIVGSGEVTSELAEETMRAMAIGLVENTLKLTKPELTRERLDEIRSSDMPSQAAYELAAWNLIKAAVARF